jgi:hypothetical protein
MCQDTLAPAAKPDTHFECVKCHAVKPVQKEGGTGYARTAEGETVCYECWPWAILNG